MPLFILAGVLTLSAIAGILLLIREHEKSRALLQEAEALKADEKAALEKLYTDPLTGCRNDRAFHEKRLACMKSETLADKPVLFAVFDAGGSKYSLKQVNDTYGYASGDRFVLEFRDAIRKAFPGEMFDLFYGGASTFYIMGYGNYSEEQIYARFLELKRCWYDVPFAEADVEAVLPYRSLQFASVLLPDAEKADARLENLLFETVNGSGKEIPDACGYYICMSPGKILTNVTERGA